MRRVRRARVVPSQSHEKKVDGFLKSVSLLSVLTDEQRTTLSNSIEEQRYTDSEYVCEVGDIADLMYFVKSGEVVATIGSEKKEVARYKAGDAFGESCLEPSADTATRKANIVAVGTVTLLKLSAEAFKEQLGSLAEVTSKNFKRKVMSAVEIEGTKMFEAFSPAQQDDLIDALEEKTEVYRSVGKMFLLSDKKGVGELLDGQMKRGQERTAQLTARAQFLDRRVREQTAEFQQLVKQATA